MMIIIPPQSYHNVMIGTITEILNIKNFIFNYLLLTLNNYIYILILYILNSYC